MGDSGLRREFSGRKRQAARDRETVARDPRGVVAKTNGPDRGTLEVADNMLFVPDV